MELLEKKSGGVPSAFGGAILEWISEEIPNRKKLNRSLKTTIKASLEEYCKKMDSKEKIKEISQEISGENPVPP